MGSVGKAGIGAGAGGLPRKTDGQPFWSPDAILGRAQINPGTERQMPEYNDF
jgi:hypothetical protein